ncbi:hypothetical protein GCM10009527_008490 [Actinomadura nitritigenes]|uniref:Uncharacterized protein n=1 Tax=Actinomadura nitritigenes TaxID=134602 RepID=A0ABS3R1Q1_9ACTN|nr:hypothetical protein [Actinomadura nitritigenes]MBO2439732.1 hypothetical protein [Actinomadura nitritigenes]
MTGWDEDALAGLRAAVARGDARAGLAALAGRPLGPVLQYAGDVLAAAVAGALGGAEAAARECRAELRARGLPGDAELAAELAAALDGRPSGLEALPVDLGAVAEALEAGPAEGLWLLDLERGDVLAPDEPCRDEPRRDEPCRDEPCGDGTGGGEPGSDDGRHLPIPPGAPAGGTEEERRGRARHWLAGQGLRPAPRSL